ncbi:uncharacterized protein LOC143181020 [Calliopsis andreniformis]|uniref:uncharacterized protein LOC143181020 n=1 Tax=Calliopsis andreniformis TaxID=337506 RepID=UPI003FCC72FC
MVNIDRVMEENITLILEETRIKVNKAKLANKSQYFASLFSHNFNDSHNKEHVINYDIALNTLQSFIKWIEDEEECEHFYCHAIKTSLTEYLKDNFTELLNLLQLSVLFMVDKLTNDIIDIIVLSWLLPDKLIDMWLLAQELNLKVLQDICLSVCLDRFNELPVALLVELSKDNIIQLLQNTNVRSSIEYLRFVRQEWIQHNMISDIPDIKVERHLKFMKGIVVYKMQEYINKDAYLYIWNDDVLSKCTELKTVQSSEKWIVGMQVASRGFSVYTVGGELGLGTGHFNQIIRRYCLISKKWYYQAKLPVPRRHMVVVFLKNKLVVVGGVGRHRLKLLTVDILDIHAGTWSKGAKVPESFTEVPPYCVMDGKLFLMKSLVYVYYIEDNYWQTISICNNPAIYRVDVMLAHDITLFLIGHHLGETVLSRIDVVKNSVCEKEECLKRYVEHSVINNTNIVYEDDSCQLRYGHMSGIGIMLLNNEREGKHQYLHLHTEMRRDFEDAFIPRLGCCNIIDLKTLYNTV